MDKTVTVSRTGSRQFGVVVRVLALVLFLGGAAVLYLQPGLSRWLNIYDEGLMVYGAVRVMDGQIPYRDFWGMYSPGQFYVLAGLFRLFGPSILVERWWDLLVRAALACVVFFLAWRLSSWPAALLVWLLTVLWLEHFGFFGYPMFTGLLMIFLSCLPLITGLQTTTAERSRQRGLMLAGVCAGVAAWFRHDLAVYAVAAQGFVIVAQRMFSAPVRSTWRARLASGLRNGLMYGGGLLTAIAPAALFLLVTVPIGELAHQLLVFPLTIFPRVRWLPYPPFELANFPFYFPFCIYALCAILAVLWLWNVRRASAQINQPTHEMNQRIWSIGAIALFGLFGFNQANIRSDLIHIPQFFLPAVVLLAPLMAGFKPLLKDFNYLVSAPVVMVMIGLAFPAVSNYISAFPQQPPPPHDVARAQGTPVDPNQLRAIQLIRQVTGPTDTIYSGVGRHDRIFVNDVMFYFLVERHSVTRYHELHPGQATTRAVQEEIVAELERSQTRYIVLSDMFNEVCEPNASCDSSGVTLLDEYIRYHYSTVAQYGAYRVLSRWR
ncbi:MAG: glycosyltransferase family 39 protein [Anaerolineae bacterium]|nr:glycosyltransferase family 39 protein [Thermoflexales bacterium]MDW8408370.1 glycosyltransferase family 39 protein [Anaerolineae bacterium]